MKKLKYHFDKIIIILILIIVVAIGKFTKSKEESIDNSHLKKEDSNNDLSDYKASSINKKDNSVDKKSESKSTDEEKTEDKSLNKDIFVHLSGCIVNEGVINMKENQRLFEAVEKAGGFCKDVDLTRVNLSLKLSDEMKIHIYKKDEISEKSEVDDNISKNSQTVKSDKVNINTADLSMLTTITGIGKSKAQAIIDYRQKQKFRNIEDIKNITGIGDKLFEKIKDFITID